MRRAGWWLLLCAALWATGASAQIIVDPTPDPEDETDWGLAMETVDLGGATLDDPSGLVMLGSRVVEEFFVLEKKTGRVRHFRDGVALGDVLDLGVDTCGERGAIDIALHPFFDRATPDTQDPQNPRADWVYLSYHTDEGDGPGDDGCDGGAELRVERRTWNGVQLVSPVVLFSKPLTPGETTQLGGGISLGLATDPAAQFTVVARLFIAVGALGRNGVLQNNRNQCVDGVIDDALLDDTGVLLRLDDELGYAGDPPADNPFDQDEDDDVDAEDRYLAYGFRDPRAILVDPPTQIFDTRVWAAERSAESAEKANDEIELLLFGKNSGYSPYTGKIPTPFEEPVDDDNVPNDDYLLCDLAETERHNETIPDSTYGNPPFTFEPTTIGPTALGFGGTEVGILHRGALFVGTEDGRLMRFRPNPGNQLLSFALGGTLADFVANNAIPDNPATPDVVDPVPADDLTQLVIATGFGRVSDIATAVDGSLYVVSGANGTIHRVFSDAVRDLAVESIKAPKKIALSTKKPVVTKSIQVTLLNRSEVPERFAAERSDDESTPDVDEAVESLRDVLENVLGLEVTPLTAGCAVPEGEDVRVVVPKYAQPPHSPVLGAGANGGKITIEVQVDWACDTPTPRGEPDFEVSVNLDMTALGIREIDERQVNNTCPRPPNPDIDPDPDVVDPDPGCGARLPDKTLGGDVVTDVTKK
jgi:glucose/arabinose dehydrogenase